MRLIPNLLLSMDKDKDGLCAMALNAWENRIESELPEQNMAGKKPLDQYDY